MKVKHKSQKGSLTPRMLKLRHTEDEKIEVGIDEAGRGSLWGPLYSAAVIWVKEEETNLSSQIKDSKKLSEKRRTALAAYIKDYALDWGIGSVSPQEIDELGMTKANQLAFRRALEKLTIMPDRLIIDGCLSIYEAPWSMTEQIVEPEADNSYIAVAAASILAKTEHDKWIETYCAQNKTVDERYDLVKNKGYGTAKHRSGILRWGEHSLHRKLFLRKLHASQQEEAIELT